MNIKYKLGKIYKDFINRARPVYSPIHSFVSRYKFQTILFILISFSALLILNYIHKAGFDSFYNELRDKDKPFYIRNVAVVLAAIATAVFTWWKNVLNHKTTEIQESTRQDGIFAQAVGFLNESNDLTTRKAGVHMLKDLAMTSPKHAQKCIDMLCSLNETWMPKFLKDYPDFFEINEDFPNIKNLEDIKLYKTTSEDDKNQFMCFCDETKRYKDTVALSQLVLLSVSEVIRHISTNIDYRAPFDLQYKFLCAADLRGIEFKKFKSHLRGINLQSARLYEADLQSANLSCANLQSANLSCANLQSADLSYANLQSADLYAVNLQLAFLIATKLKLARLTETNLQSANLSHATMESAFLFNTDLRNAKGITEDVRNKYMGIVFFTDEDYKRHYPNGKPKYFFYVSS